MDTDESERPLKDVDGLQDRILQRATITLDDRFDQVGRDLGIGLGPERVSLGLQFRPQDIVVLDDPVVDESESLGAVRMRVSVLVRRCTVSGPPCMPYPERALQGLAFEFLSRFWIRPARRTVPTFPSLRTATPAES